MADDGVSSGPPSPPPDSPGGDVGSPASIVSPMASPEPGGAAIGTPSALGSPTSPLPHVTSSSAYAMSPAMPDRPADHPPDVLSSPSVAPSQRRAAVLDCDGAYIGTDVPTEDDVAAMCMEYADGMLERDAMKHAHEMIEAMQRRHLPADPPVDHPSMSQTQTSLFSRTVTSRPCPEDADEVPQDNLVASALQYLAAEEEMRRGVVTQSEARAWGKVAEAVAELKALVAAALAPTKRERSAEDKQERWRRKEMKKLAAEKKAELHRAWMESAGLSAPAAERIAKVDQMEQQRKVEEANRMTCLLRKEFRKARPPFATAQQDLWERDVTDRPGEARAADEYHTMAAALRKAYWAQRLDREETHREAAFRTAQAAAQGQRPEFDARNDLRYLGGLRAGSSSVGARSPARGYVDDEDSLARYEHELLHGPTVSNDRDVRTAHQEAHRPAWR
eukprot:TRINITY_DN28240_c0_g1_i1.p1 TRINITY_DN28240_c0_g1~~TRINITY_DN28240_c0_g1_i1.p1  ORF type:complete len:448 (+),score=146.86 TRINITY_DN28240_c0_g1_i1:85-1428(+)